MFFPYRYTASVSLFLLGFGFCSITQAQSRHRQLSPALSSMMDSTKTPGISLALIEEGVITLSIGVGKKDKSKNEPVSSKTIFRGASLGKPLFAYAVIQLSQEGLLDLDTPIFNYTPQSYLEESFLKGPLADARIKLITPRMILTHTSGLPNWRAEGKPLMTLFTPGSRYSYSGEGYFLLQRVVEHLTKESIESLMQRKVFVPLKMKNTSYVYHPHQAKDYALSYDQAGNLNIDEVEPANVAHTLRTTADDYARFLVAVILKKNKEKQPINTLFSSQVSTDICQPGLVSWSLGFAVQHSAQGDFFCQWAKSPSASGYVIGSVDGKRALVYFVNVANQGLRIAERMVKLGLNYEDPLFSCFGVRPYNAKP